MSLTNSWNNYWDSVGGYEKGWENMTEAQRIAHSLHFGTDFAKKFDPNQQLTFGGTTQTPDFWYEGQSLFNDIQNYQPAPEPTPEWQNYGFRNESGYNQFVNNWDDKFDINTGAINQDWWDSLSYDQQKDYFHDITSAGIGISNKDLSSGVRNSVRKAWYADNPIGGGSGDFTFGHGSVAQGTGGTGSTGSTGGDVGADNSVDLGDNEPVDPRETYKAKGNEFMDAYTTRRGASAVGGEDVFPTKQPPRQSTPWADAFIRSKEAAEKKGPVSSLFKDFLGE